MNGIERGYHITVTFDVSKHLRDTTKWRPKIYGVAKYGSVDESTETTEEHFNDVELLSAVTLINLFETS